ncbi:MAG TPA: hypothetical protein VF714_04625, partial [Jatrophihabitans sp.]
MTRTLPTLAAAAAAVLLSLLGIVPAAGQPRTGAGQLRAAAPARPTPVSVVLNAMTPRSPDANKPSQPVT